jgi:hypothetical protein
MGTVTQASRTLVRSRLVSSANSSSNVERRSVKVEGRERRRIGIGHQGRKLAGHLDEKKYSSRGLSSPSRPACTRIGNGRVQG